MSDGVGSRSTSARYLSLTEKIGSIRTGVQHWCRRKTLCVLIFVSWGGPSGRDASAEVLAEQQEWNPFLASSIL